MENEPLHIIAIFAPDTAKQLENFKSFCQQLQDEINVISTKERILIMGDMNARIGKDVIKGVKKRFNEDVTNDQIREGLESGTIITCSTSSNTPTEPDLGSSRLSQIELPTFSGNYAE
ncbi:hypothetical protein M0802_012384 [Mischocyttarus mexicanus]|nr:hypothetical protein M0802_012384 [Mischocyttarus mexicanus]